MNQHVNQDILWKNQNFSPSTANGNSFEDKSYHGHDKGELTDRVISNTSFNQFHTKLTPVSKAKEYMTYSEVDSRSYADGNYVQNRSFTSRSSIPKQQSYSDPVVPSNMLPQFDNGVEGGGTQNKLRPNSDKSSVTDDYLWFYLDPRNNVQGPFLDSQMFQWWSQGIYFQNSLFMKRKCDAEFSTLQDYSKRFNGVPFNRKDIRVPPLTESLSVTQSFTNGPLGMSHRPAQVQPSSQPPNNEPNYFMHLMPSGQNNDDLSKLFLQKASLQQRNQVYEQCQNGADMTSGQTSLSNFVNLRQNTNGVMQSPQTSVFSKTDRFSGSSWTPVHQPNLTDSVWMSTNDDPVPSCNPVWSRSTNDTGPSLLNSIFHDSQSLSQQQLPSNPIAKNSHSKSLNPMHDTWDNLDPAIIKIVPGGEPSPSSSSSNHTFDGGKSPRDNTNSTHQMDQRQAYPTSHNNPQPPTQASTRTHNDTVKNPWAALVRKANSGPASNQQSKSQFNTEHFSATNHSVSANQHKTSVTSSSSDECDQRRRCESTDKEIEALIEWCRGYLEKKPGIGEVDIGTLMELLMYVESPYEVEATMRENVPLFDNITDFVKVFIEKRRPLRQRLFSEERLVTRSVAPVVAAVAVVVAPAKTDGANGVLEPGLDPEAGQDCSQWQVKTKGHGGPGGAATRRKRAPAKHSGARN